MNYIYFPKKVKFIKVHKHHLQMNYKNFILKKKYIRGFYGLFLSSFGFIKGNHIELIRRFLTKIAKKYSKINRRVTLVRPFTKKASKARMGKGVGKLNFWGSYVYPGKVLFEIQAAIMEKDINIQLKTLNKKLPFNCKLFSKQMRALNINLKKKINVQQFTIIKKQ